MCKALSAQQEINPAFFFAAEITLKKFFFAPQVGAWGKGPWQPS